MTRRWLIYHGLREYARETGDPLLGVVEAASKDEAERLAAERGLGVAGVGCWAVEDAAVRCIAYREDGRVCGTPATVLNAQRGGMVCRVHAPAAG